jgi:hypothetical protein
MIYDVRFGILSSRSERSGVERSAFLSYPTMGGVDLSARRLPPEADSEASQ